jgi:hypothetical protein
LRPRPLRSARVMARARLVRSTAALGLWLGIRYEGRIFYLRWVIGI